jgi:hypothetical protein
VNQKVLPCPRRAVGADFAAHQVRDAAGNRQAEAGAAVLARGRGIGLLEGMEQPRHGVGRNADPGVLHLEAHQHGIAAVFQQPGAQRYRTLRGELDGVAGIVEQPLAQPRRIAAQPQRNGIAIERDIEPLVPRRLADDGRDAVEDRRKRKVGAFQLQAAGLDLGQVENVVDDAQQVRPALSILSSVRPVPASPRCAARGG